MKNSVGRHCMKFVAAATIAIGFYLSEGVTPIAAAAPTAIVPGQPPATSKPAPAPVASSTAKHPFSLSIVSVDPAAPVAGQKITITYIARNLAAGNVLAHPSASIGGGNPQTANGRPPVDTVYPGNQSVTGTLVITAGAVGSSLIELTMSTTPCGVNASGPACAATIYAQATKMVSLVPPPAVPTTRVRIAGTSYANIHKGDPSDGTIVSSGYYFVVHDPGCNTHFSTGNNGNDTFFVKKDLPAGATLKAVDFTMYRVPPTLKTEYYAGGVGGAGSYGVKVEHDSGNAMHVHWENACSGPYKQYQVVYVISFEIEIPNGTNLGEDTTLATAQPFPPSSVNYTTLGVVTGSSNAAAALVPEPNLEALKFDGEAYSYTFAPAPAGTISAVYNNEPDPIVLIADSRIGAGCAPGNGNVLLAGHTTTTAEQFAGLYGAGPVHTPKKFTACRTSSPPPTATSSVYVTLTFLQDQ